MTEEEDISYYGNDLSKMKKPDVASCRSSCSSMGAGYFTYRGDIFEQDSNMCYCKDSNAGRGAGVGRVSGATSCPGEFRLQNICFKKFLFSTQPYSECLLVACNLCLSLSRHVDRSRYLIYHQSWHSNCLKYCRL